MTDTAILTAKTAEKLIQTGTLQHLPELYASVSMPASVKQELLANPATEAAANNLPSGIYVREVDKLEAGAQTMRNNGDISQGEAEAITLAKELTSNGRDYAFVLTENPKIEEHLYSKGPDIHVFAANSWGVWCHADEKGILDLDRVKSQFEKIAPMNAETNKLVSLYTDIKHERELGQAREQGQVH